LSDERGDQGNKGKTRGRRIAPRCSDSTQEFVAVAVRPSEGPHGNSIVARRDARPSDVCQSSNGPANVSGMNYRQISGAKTCPSK
jgi:hypothetical protein